MHLQESNFNNKETYICLFIMPRQKMCLKKKKETLNLSFPGAPESGQSPWTEGMLRCFDTCEISCTRVTRRNGAIEFGA